MPDLPACASKQLGVFTADQAREHGLTRHQVQHLLAMHRLVALRRGVYVDSAAYTTMTGLDRSRAVAVAACLSMPGTVVSHHSAALIHGLPLLGTRPAQPALTSPPHGGLRSGMRNHTSRIHLANLPAWQLERRGAWAVTTPARTVCDLSRELAPLSALVAMDAALCRGLMNEQDAWAVADSCASWPGSQLLRSLVRQAKSGSESPYETVARWLLTRAGYQAIPQVWAFDDKGPIGCGDLWLPSQWVFLEIDGDVKYGKTADPEVLLIEKRRQERLQDAGFGLARTSPRETRAGSLLAGVERAAAIGRLSRQAAVRVTGYIGPPPRWAHRGTLVPIGYPPERHQSGA